MENFELKVRLALLWLGYFCVMIVVPTLDLYVPGYIEEIVTGGQIIAGMILFLAAFMVIPPIMVILSMTLRGTINRWVNIIGGVVFTGFSLIGPIEWLLAPSVYSAYYLLIAVVQIVITVLIVWCAWKWPKPDATS